MGFSYLLKTSEDIEFFKVRFNIPRDVNILYCHDVDILYCHRTLSFYGLSPNQCLPNFHIVVNCVGHLNQLYSLSLTHYDNNFLYAIQGSLKNGYYLQTQNITVKLISFASPTPIGTRRGNL